MIKNEIFCTYSVVTELFILINILEKKNNKIDILGTEEMKSILCTLPRMK